MSHQAASLMKATPAAFNLLAVALQVRGGDESFVEAFDMELAKLRMEGLAYDIVAALMLNAALQLFSSSPRTLEPIPSDPQKAKAVKFVGSVFCTKCYFIKLDDVRLRPPFRAGVVSSF
jgi:hypothetical protein